MANPAYGAGITASSGENVNGELVVGNDGPLPAGTANVAGELTQVIDANTATDGTVIVKGTKDTTPPLLVPRVAGDYVSPPLTNTGTIGRISSQGDYGFDAGTTVPGEVDTTGAFGGATTVPTSTAMTGSVDTLQPGQIGAGNADPVYRASSSPVAGTIFDSTRTNLEPGGSLTNPTPGGAQMTENPSILNIGRLDQNGNVIGNTSVVPDAPTSVTSVTGPRSVTVSWVHPADPSLDPVRGYVVVNSSGGTTYAPASATSVVVTNLVPSDDPTLYQDGTTYNLGEYTFKVAARNSAGFGPLSTASTPVIRPYNPDETDPLKPAGLDSANRLNAIYKPDGTTHAGTGSLNAPTAVTPTIGAQTTTNVSVAWTAPATGPTPTSYIVTPSKGTIAAGTTTTSAASPKVISFDPGGIANVTFVVRAVYPAGTGANSAASAAIRVPGGLNNAPVLGAVTAGAAASKTVTVAWTAPTLGNTPTSYKVKASDGTTVSPATSPQAVVFAAAGASVTFTVQATNASGAGAVSAASAPVTVP
jgi:hypothetical protein